MPVIVPITEPELTTARSAWGVGLVKIAEAHETGGIESARTVASRMLDELYGYQLGPVLFKPTMASGHQTFRPTKQGALSYFVGHDPEYRFDNGFGLNQWQSVQSETAASFIHGDVALWMGHVMITNKEGQITTVDKSFGYTKDANGLLRIVLHHSSLPYQP